MICNACATAWSVPSTTSVTAPTCATASARPIAKLRHRCASCCARSGRSRDPGRLPMNDMPRPHDLLWGLTPSKLPADAPAWARQVLAAGQPVVVRRAFVARGQVAGGARGASRDQRFATTMELSRVALRVPPEQLVRRLPTGALPAFRALTLLKPFLDELSLVWGVTGSVGYQLACGVTAVRVDSDLDLLLRTPQPLSRQLAGEL